MKHAVVTGGASGLGLALAIRLHGDGWAVDLWDRDVTGLESALAGREKVTRRVVDVRSAEEVRRAFEELRAEPGLVFHAAGSAMSATSRRSASRSAGWTWRSTT